MPDADRLLPELQAVLDRVQGLDKSANVRKCISLPEPERGVPGLRTLMYRACRLLSSLRSLLSGKPLPRGTIVDPRDSRKERLHAGFWLCP
jgi:hypothetical protein